jgi:hypothetical protein
MSSYTVYWTENEEVSGALPDRYTLIEAANQAARAWLLATAGDRPYVERAVATHADGRIDLAFDFAGRDGVYGDPMGGGFIAAWVEEE